MWRTDDFDEGVIGMVSRQVEQGANFALGAILRADDAGVYCQGGEYAGCGLGRPGCGWMFWLRRRTGRRL